MCIAVQWGFATFLWNYFCYSAVFMNEEKIYFYHKRKKQEISLENIAEIKAALGNVAYTFFDENNNMLFEVQMKKENAYQLVEYIKKGLAPFKFEYKGYQGDSWNLKSAGELGKYSLDWWVQYATNKNLKNTLKTSRQRKRWLH